MEAITTKFKRRLALFVAVIMVLGLWTTLPLRATAAESDYEYTTDNTTHEVTVTKYKGSDKTPIVPQTLGGNPVTTIGNGVFTTSNIMVFVTSVTLQAGVVKIDKHAFWKSNDLTSVVLPAGLKVIGEEAFSDCDELKSISIPNSVTDLGNNAFYGCKNLKSVTGSPDVKDMLLTFGECRALTSYTVPNGVETLAGTFRNCNSLTSVSIPASVTTIGTDTFSGCASLTEITIPATVTTIAYDAFNNHASDLIIYVSVGSEAERYAEKNGIDFSMVGGPGKPQNFEVTTGNRQATLSWDAPAKPGASPIQGYEVRYDGYWTGIGNSRNHTVTNLENGKKYFFEVRARNNNGYGVKVGQSATLPADKTPVHNQAGEDAAIYSPGGIDLTTLDKLFTKDPHAGASTYSLKEGQGSITGSVLQVTKCGTFKIGLTTAETGNYAAGGEVISTLTVNPKSISEATVSVAPGPYPYTAAAQKPSVTVTLDSGTLTKDTDYTVLYKDNINAGSATVSVAGTNNYSGATAGTTFTIGKKAASVTGIKVDNKTYDGTQDAAISGTPALSGILAGDVNDVTLNSQGVSYTFADKNVGNNITVTQNGTYLLTGGKAGNYELAQTTFTANITKATPDIKWPTAAAVTYGAKLSESILSGGSGPATFAWTNGTTIPTVNNSGYEVTLTPTDKGNYDYTGVKLTDMVNITVNKAPGSFVNLTAIGVTYKPALKLSDVTLPGAYAWKNGNTSIDAGDNQKFGATYTADVNHSAADGEITVNVAKADGAKVDAPGIAGKTRNSVTLTAVTADTVQEVEYAINTSDAVPLSGWQEGLTFSNLLSQTDYWFFARAKESKNYTIGPVSSSTKATTDIEYVLTVENGTGGGSYAAGEQVDITADPAPVGEVFDRWQSSIDGTFGDVNNAKTTFTMPAHPVTVTATYKEDTKDSDGDGVPDYVENNNGTDPNDPNSYKDSDGDGVPDYVEEHAESTDPNDPNDFKDSDGDGVPDYVEEHVDGTDPNDPNSYKDSDGDGVPDYIENKDGTDPNDPNSYKDSDGDGVPDYVENKDGTDPNDPNSYKDSDGDGVPDYVENKDGTDPNDPNSYKDSDGDGVPDYVENNDGTDPNDPNDFKDADGDGIPDYVENLPDPPTPPATLSGWVYDDGNWYFYENGGHKHIGWLYYKHNWYFLDYKDGHMLAGWQRDNKTWYYLAGSGAMQTGWTYDKSCASWFYLSGNGAMETGWAKVGGAWYYFTGNGKMAAGSWVKYKDNWYYLCANGAMAKDSWIKYRNNWYYLRPVSGTMPHDKWLKYKGNQYYLKSDGRDAISETLIIGGRPCSFDSTGKLKASGLPALTSATARR